MFAGCGSCGFCGAVCLEVRAWALPRWAGDWCAVNEPGENGAVPSVRGGRGRRCGAALCLVLLLGWCALLPERVSLPSLCLACTAGGRWPGVGRCGALV